MGITDSLKDLYFEWEEKYYKLLDKIDEKIPIYKIVDPVDELVPSFALLLVAAVVVLLLAIGIIASIVLVPTTSTLTIVTLKGSNAISGVNVAIEHDGITDTFTTDSEGKAAISGIAKGTTVSITATKQGYVEKTESVDVTENEQVVEIAMAEESTQTFTKTIRIVDAAGASITEPLTLTFSCSHYRATTPSPINLASSDRGVATVQVPSNCERLSIQVSDADEYQNTSLLQVNSDPFTIQLQETQRSTGKIVVNLKDIEGNAISETIQVDLYKYDELLQNPETGPVDFEYAGAGQAFFDKSPGTYVVKTYDSSGVYGEESSGPITIAADQTEEVTLTLEETVKGKIKIKVIDSESGKGIEDAKVTLSLSSGEQALSSDETSEDGEVEFNISRDVEYKATVEASGYVLKKKTGLKISDKVYEIEIQKCTASLCGKLIVKVIDQDGKNIDNATVALYDSSSNLLAGYSNIVTDLNGVAKFSSVSNGQYYAFAFKETISGKSDTAYFNSVLSDDDGIDLTVVMQVPEGIIRAAVKDKDGAAVPFPRVVIYNGRDNTEIGQVLGNAEGVLEFTTKADKYVYLTVKKKDASPPYADYTTVSKQVVGQSITNFEVTLEPEIIDEDIEVDFMGLFKGEEEAATILTAGEKYTAKFRLRVPEEKEYEEAGMHVRTGEDIVMEKDKLYIGNVNAPGASIVKATRYDEYSGLDEQQYDFTNSDAKWVNVYWNDPAAGIYEVEADVYVRDTATINNILTVWWRAWAQDGARERFPKDSRQGIIELYSEALKRTYEVGVSTLCTEEFCFWATIRDPELALVESVTDSYTAKILQEYEIKFALINNSNGRVHNKANLRVEDPTESIKFLDYTFTNADNAEAEGTVNATEFPRLDAGEFREDEQLILETSFVPIKPAPATINITFVSDEQIVYSKSIAINISAMKELQVTVLPTIYPSGIETDVNVTVKDRTTGLEIEDAAVKLLDRHDNVLLTTTTGKDGVAYITIPAQNPGEKLFIEVEKPEYKTSTTEITIQSEVLEISPEQLGLTLNIKDKPETSENEGVFTAKNRTYFPLKISKVRLVIDEIDKRSLLDLEKTEEWLDGSYLNLVLAPGDRREMRLRAFLSEEALELMDREELTGRIEIEVSNFGTAWSFTVPVTVSIGIGGEVDDPGCLLVSRKEWQASTEGDPIIAEFLIENNCTVEGKPIDLQDLEAQVVWKSNTLGIYSITVEESQTELRSGYFRTLLGRLQSEQSVPVTLTFTPYGAVNGVAEADIVIRARNPLEGSDQYLSNTIASKLTIVNLVNCVSVDRDIIVVDPGTTAPFTISTVNCGTPVDFEVSSEIELSNTEFTVQDNGSQAVEVMPEEDIIPGQYPIFIKAKFSEAQKEQLIMTVRARVPHEGCIELSKYEFDVYDDPDDDSDGYDTATLTNNCYDKIVNVKVSMKDFSDAMKSAVKWALLAFGVSLLDKGLGSMWGGDDEDNTSTDGIPDNLKKMESYTDPRTGTIYTTNIYEDPDTGEVYTKRGNNYVRIGASTASEEGLPVVTVAETGTTNTTAATASTTATGNEAQYDTMTINGNDAKYKEAFYVIYSNNTDSQDPGELMDIYYSSSNGRYYASNGAQVVEVTPKYGEDKTTPLYYEIPSNSAGGDITIPHVVLSTSGFASMYNARFRDIPMLTGYASATSTSTSGSSGGLLGGIFGGGSSGSSSGGIFGMGGSLLDGILGKGSPISQAGKVFLIATVVEYYSQEDEVEYRTVQSDVEIPYIGGITIHPLESGVTTLSSIVSFGIYNIIDEDVSLEREILSSIEDSESTTETTLTGSTISTSSDNSELSIEKIGLVLTNKSGFTTTQYEPLYKLVRVLAERHEYTDKTYEKDDFDVTDESGWFDFDTDEEIDVSSIELEEEDAEIMQQQFHVEFNSVPPELSVTEYSGILNCQDGVRTGSTGEDALPKVLFSWNWAEIDADQCDVDNDTSTYCDATQFSIEVLKKIHTIADFVEQNASNFECPSPLDSYSNVSEIGSYDIGISKISVNKMNKDAQISLTIENTNPGQINSEVVIQLKSADTGEDISGQECEQTIEVLSEGEIECEFTDLDSGNYRAEATITPDISCTNCRDSTGSNSLGIGFTIGETGLEECEPYSTSRLEEILNASGIQTDSSQEALDAVNFEARLIEDRYSSDFQKDFDFYMTTQAFFQVDNYYLEDEGLGAIFTDKELFRFTPSVGEANPEGYKLPAAGIYDVTIDITYGDNSWALFDEDGNPNATVTVLLEKVDSPKPNSPFYSMPFDGPLGEDGRTGYGLNYNLDNADNLEPVIINNSIPIVKTLEFTNSTPAGELTASIQDDFGLLNTTNRGVVLSVIAGETPEIVFSPSYATPLILEMENNTDEAWALYSIEVNGGAQSVGPQPLTKWNGIGLNCKGFDDKFMSEYFFMGDTHATQAECARTSGELKNTSYGIEVCEPVKFGKMFLKTTLYTPQSSDSTMKLVSASDTAKLITKGAEGSIVSLNTETLGKELSTVEDVFDAVKDEYICISNTESKTEFWWNPKKVMELVQEQEDSVINECITE